MESKMVFGTKTTEPMTVAFVRYRGPFRIAAATAELGRRARETVREKFLITRLLSDYLDMLNSLMCQ